MLGRAAVIVARPELLAADRANDALLTAKAALRRAVTLRAAADLQVDQLRELVARLEGNR